MEVEESREKSSEEGRQAIRGGKMPAAISYTLVVSSNASCRKLYVDNLVRRGYLAISVASAIEAEGLLGTTTPDLVLVCCMPVGYEQEIEQLRTTYQLAGTLVLVGRDRPDPVWAALWRVDVCRAEPMDVRQLVEILRPWLPAKERQSQSTRLFADRYYWVLRGSKRRSNHGYTQAFG
jgi:DNA-binding response OmpR family regulator